MKPLLILSMVLSAFQFGFEVMPTHPDVSPILKQTTFDLDELYKTWYVKQILVDGQEDKENYPSNNDELTLNRDMTLISVDRLVDEVNRSTWEIKKPDMFIIHTEEGSALFKILKLTASELETRMMTDEFDMVIKYRSDR